MNISQAQLHRRRIEDPAERPCSGSNLSNWRFEIHALNKVMPASSIVLASLP
jgi:hypothetical protein